MLELKNIAELLEVLEGAAGAAGADVAQASLRLNPASRGLEVFTVALCGQQTINISQQIDSGWLYAIEHNFSDWQEFMRRQMLSYLEPWVRDLAEKVNR
jgi:hypothetical protein